MAVLLKNYKKILNKWPVAVQAVQAGALMGVGDILAQTLVEGKQFREMNIKRALQFSSVGLIVIGPSLRVWYGILDKFVKGSSHTIALKKMAADQLFFAPIFLTVVMGSISFAQGQTIAAARERVVHDYPDVLLANYKLWPAVQLINFYVVPLRHQVLSVQIVALFWNTYLSWKSNVSMDEESC